MSTSIWNGNTGYVVDGEPEDVASLINYSTYVRIVHSDQTIILRTGCIDSLTTYTGAELHTPPGTIEKFYPQQPSMTGAS